MRDARRVIDSDSLGMKQEQHERELAMSEKQKD